MTFRAYIEEKIPHITLIRKDTYYKIFVRYGIFVKFE